MPKAKLLPELEASALTYGMGSTKKSGEASKEELILVFDLGGRTFDISTLEVDWGVMDVLATVGNINLGVPILIKGWQSI